MGADGGTIPTRGELVKTQKRPEKPSESIQLQTRWNFCALSKQPLQQPIVACGMGKLYNKDAVIEYLLNPKVFGDGDVICRHVMGLADVVTLNLTVNSSNDSSQQNSSNGNNSNNNNNNNNTDDIKAQFMCPVTMKEMNGKTRFVYFKKCGCVVSEQALKQVPSKTCYNCGKEIGDVEENIVVIHSTDEKEIEKMQEKVDKIVEARELEKEEKRRKKELKKKEKKAKKDKEVDGDGEEGSSNSNAKKRKGEDLEDGGNVAKKTGGSINMRLPEDLKALDAGNKNRSSALKSLFHSSGDKGKDGSSKDKDKIQNPFFSGTFNRYV